MRREYPRGGKTGTSVALCVAVLLSSAAFAQEEDASTAFAQEEDASTGVPADAETAPSEAATGEPAAGEAPPLPKSSILVLDVTLVDIPPGIEKILIGPISSEVARDPDLAVLTGQDVRRLTEFEADRIRAGCDEESCASEIADALGADLVVFSTLGRLGTAYIFNMTLIETASARALGRVSANADDVSELREVVEVATHNLMSRYRREVGRSELEPPDSANNGGPAPAAPEAAAGPNWASIAYIGGVTALAATLFATGAAIDIFSPTSRNRELDGIDFVGPGLMLTAVAIAVIPFVFNPFTSTTPTDATATAVGRRE